MRHRITALIAVLLLALVAAPAAAVTVTPTGTILGRVEATWLANGGAAKLGNPVGTETKIVAYGRNTYHQHTTLGATVYWDGSQGGKVWTAGNVPSLSGVSAERDALGRYGYRSGVLYRSAKLCNASTADKRLVTAMMHGGTILDLRTSGTCSEPSFPSVVGKLRISIPSHADYSRYITGSTERAQFGKVLTAAANAPGPVWVHCTAGKDRTGWTVALIMWAIGADTGTVRAEYLRTSGADEADFQEGLVTMFDRYDGVEGYLLDGLGLTPDTIAKLNAKFGA